MAGSRRQLRHRVETSIAKKRYAFSPQERLQRSSVWLSLVQMSAQQFRDWSGTVICQRNRSADVAEVCRFVIDSQRVADCRHQILHGHRIVCDLHTVFGGLAVYLT